MYAWLYPYHFAFNVRCTNGIRAEVFCQIKFDPMAFNNHGLPVRIMCVAIFLNSGWLKAKLSVEICYLFVAFAD